MPNMHIHMPRLLVYQPYLSQKHKYTYFYKFLKVFIQKLILKN